MGNSNLRGNTGYRNTGNCNTGDWNTGNCNTGYRNTGNCNTGDWNTGYRNTGYCNAGNCNTGDFNTGYWNAGYRNAGNFNTGDWNTGSRNTGFCNSITPDEVLVFNKPCLRSKWDESQKPNWMFVELTKWISESKMTSKEKEANPSYVTTGGYLKAYSSLTEAYVEAWEMASEEDKRKTFELPNYDEKVFKEVFGFTPVMSKKVKVVCEGKEVWLSEESARNLNLI